MSNRSRLPGPVRVRLRSLMNSMAVDSTNVELGDGFSAGRGAIVSAPHSLKIGRSVSIGPRSVVQVDGRIGDWVMIGMNVHIVGRRDHALDEVGVPMLASTWVGDREGSEEDAVTIGDDVWIGASAVVLSGLTIGAGSVVAAGSVVVGDVPPFSIVAGVPARVVGTRFSSDAERAEHLRVLGTYEYSPSGVGTRGTIG